MTDKKSPQLVPASLFGASSQASGLSLGMDDFIMSSPVTLGVGASSTKETTKAPSPISSSKSSPSQSLTSSPLSKRKEPMRTISSPATSSPAELTTVPLTTPPPVTTKQSDSISQQVPVISSFSQPQKPPGSEMLTEPKLSVQPEDDYSIHPLVKPDKPPGEVAVAANPYRLSAQQQKKPIFPASPFMSPSQPTMAAPPRTMPAPSSVIPPSSLPMPPASSVAPPFQRGAPPIQQGAPPSVVTHNAGIPPVRPHWFYKRTGEDHWTPFSFLDSNKLESQYLLPRGPQQGDEVIVATDGGRYDVKFYERMRYAIYWKEDSCPVRRCTWFYHTESDRWLQPYEEEIAQQLEVEFIAALKHNQWNKRVELGTGEAVIMHSPQAIVHYPPPPNTSQVHFEEHQNRPKAVRREFPNLEHITQGEQSRIDHLVFVVHGIGPVCDMSFRKLVDCVDDFREVSQLMLSTHQFTGQQSHGGDQGGRVEFLPVHWHDTLHSDDTGVDCRLKPITLPSISRLRDFTNSTLLDILFYTSPVHCQTIVSEVVDEVNRMYQLFHQRNPRFTGGVSLMGHSLGSCILYDILTHQGGGAYRMNDVFANDSNEMAGEDLDDVPLTLKEAMEQLGLDDYLAVLEKEQIDLDSLLLINQADLKELSIPMGPRKKLADFITTQADRIKLAKDRAKQKAEREVDGEQTDSSAADLVRDMKFSVSMEGVAGTGQPYVSYKQLEFKPCHLFLVGSPVGLFLTVRGVEKLGEDYHLPTCPCVHNIFHPFDPVAYRLEPLVTPSSWPPAPYLMPHHKGRKRFHLELYENLGKMGANLKQNIVEGVRNMLASINEFARSHTSSGAQQEATPITAASPEPEELTNEQENTDAEEMVIGKLNQGNRIDCVLQEKPIEKLNEYLFALSSHLCYWRSEDTALFVLKKTYNEDNPPLVKE